MFRIVRTGRPRVPSVAARLVASNGHPPPRRDCGGTFGRLSVQKFECAGVGRVA
jgi:hypothetical protein